MQDKSKKDSTTWLLTLSEAFNPPLSLEETLEEWAMSMPHV